MICSTVFHFCYPNISVFPFRSLSDGAGLLDMDPPSGLLGIAIDRAQTRQFLSTTCLRRHNALSSAISINVDEFQYHSGLELWVANDYVLRPSLALEFYSTKGLCFLPFSSIPDINRDWLTVTTGEAPSRRASARTRHCMLAWCLPCQLDSGAVFRFEVRTGSDQSGVDADVGSGRARLSSLLLTSHRLAPPA